MNKNGITIEQAILIRKEGRNPDVAIGPSFHFRNLLNNPSYKKCVRFFKKRTNEWYFDIAERLARRKRHRSGDIFVVMILNCIIIDLLSQYRYGSEASQRKFFKKFVKEHLSQYEREITPNIISCHFDKGWKRDDIDSVSEALYHGFRCGLVHSARILEYGRINMVHDDAIVILPWTDTHVENKRDIHVNPPLLLRELKVVFKHYIDNLLYSDIDELKTNFISKFAFDYGIKIQA